MSKKKFFLPAFFTLAGILFSQTAFSQEVKNGVLAIKEGAESVGESAYAGRKDILKVVCPKSLKTINARAFANCPSLTSVELNEGLGLIGFEAFLDCASLSKISFPESLETILARAFCGTQIKTAALPKNLKNVDANSFPSGVVKYDVFRGVALKPIDIDLDFPTRGMPDEKYIVKGQDARVVNLDFPVGIYANNLGENKGSDAYATGTVTLPVIDRDYQFLVEALGGGGSRYECATGKNGQKIIRITVGPVEAGSSHMAVIRLKLMQIPLEYNGYISDKFPNKYGDWEKFFLLPSAASGGVFPDHPYFQELAAWWKKETMSPPELGKRAFVYPWRHLVFSESCVKKDPPWALKIGEGDCTEFSGIYVTLCRAMGIPARQISVITYDMDLPRKVTGTNHSLSEVYMEPVGWFAVDANLGGGSIRGKHRFGYIPPRQICLRPENADYVSYPKLNESKGGAGLGEEFQVVYQVSKSDVGEAHELYKRNVRKKNASLAKNIALPSRIPPLENFTEKEVLKGLYENKFTPPPYKPIEIGLNRLSPYEERRGAHEWYSEPPDSFHAKGKKTGDAKEGLIDGTMYIREGVWEIYSREYFSKPAIKKLFIPSTVVKIGSFAFQNCVNLKEVEIPSSVKEIEAGAFQNCVHLEKIILHEGLEKIGDFAFKNTCAASVEIPGSVKEIGSECFGICSKLSSIVVKKGSKAAEALKGDKRLTFK